MSPTAFRALIVCSIVSSLAASLLDALIPELLPASLAAALENEPVPAFLGMDWLAAGIAAIAALIAVVAGAVGMFLFKRWGRSLSFWLSAAALLAYPVSGPVVFSGWSAALYELSTIIWGAVLALAYFSPLAARFGDPAPAAPA